MDFLKSIQCPGPPSGFPGGASGKEPPCQCRRLKRCGFDPWVRKMPWSRKWQPTPVFLPGIFHGQRSLGIYSPWGHKESDMTERLSMRVHTQAGLSTQFLCPLDVFSFLLYSASFTFFSLYVSFSNTY